MFQNSISNIRERASYITRLLTALPMLFILAGCGSNDYKYMCEGTMRNINRGTIKDGESFEKFKDQITFSRQQGVWAAYHSAAGRFETRLGFSEKHEFETEILVNLFKIEIFRRSNPLIGSITKEERYTINRLTGNFEGYSFYKGRLPSDYLFGVEYNGTCKSI